MAHLSVTCPSACTRNYWRSESRSVCSEATTRGRSTRVTPDQRESVMSEKPVLQPGPDHPITVVANPNRVVVSVGGRVVANTDHALVLQESTYPAVQYIPMSDVDQTLLERTENASYCPYKGDASYYSITAGGERSVNASLGLRIAVPGRGRHQGPRGLLPGPGRRHRRADLCLIRAPVTCRRGVHPVRR